MWFIETCCWWKAEICILTTLVEKQRAGELKSIIFPDYRVHFSCSTWDAEEGCLFRSVFSVNKNAVCCLTPFPFHIMQDESFGSSHTGCLLRALTHQLCHSPHFPPCPILSIPTATSSDTPTPEVGISCVLCEWVSLSHHDLELMWEESNIISSPGKVTKVLLFCPSFLHCASAAGH